MEYTYESQKRAIEYLIKNAPHDIEKFRNLYNVNIAGENRAEAGLYDILFSTVWTAEEKVQLIQLYGYNDVEKHPYNLWTSKIQEKNLDTGYSTGIDGLPLIDECIKERNFSGVQALLSLGNHISVATIRRIIEYIDDSSERYKFCELIVNHYKDKENIKAYVGIGNQCNLTRIPSLCDYYPRHATNYYTGEESFSNTVSSMADICATNDLELVKLFLPTVKNINSLFVFAIRSGNIEIVKLFIEAGADVNFQNLAFQDNIEPSKTPLKIAIDNNDLEMVKFLHQNGAHLDFVDKSERIEELIGNLGKKEEKKAHEYENDSDIRAYITLTKTPLEYAITIGAASIIKQDLSNTIITGKNVEKQFKDRMDIVKYLYTNGATFGDGQINYTDLICFAIKSDDFASTKYYFEEALKKGSKVDFVKIIYFIHTPGFIKTSCYSTAYKAFEEGANPWFRLCEEYSKKIDTKNYNRNIKLMLENIVYNFSTRFDFQFNMYRDVITDFTNLLPKDMLKDIPAIFCINLENLEEFLSLGYDINSIKNGRNILMEYIINRPVNIEIINKLISLGVNINYQDHQSGDSPLSCAIAKLPKYDFGKFIDNFNLDTGKLYHLPVEYEKETKSLVKELIGLSNQEIIISKGVKESVYRSIEPGYSQIIYNEILQALSKKGFKVDDDYVTKSITFLDEPYSHEFVTNPWEYLWNLYSNFPNKSIFTNYEFPKIENIKAFKYGTEQSNNLFALINEHLKRNFATSAEEIPEPNKIVEKRYNSTRQEYESIPALQVAQDRLLSEISRYIGNLDYRQIITLIDSFSLIDINSIIKSKLLPIALNVGDEELCRKLIKRGFTIIRYDENGRDITSTKYSIEQINNFLSLTREYNPDKEYEDLLLEIGCGGKMLSKNGKKPCK